jgi:hypothetical protein
MINLNLYEHVAAWGVLYLGMLVGGCRGSP